MVGIGESKHASFGVELRGYYSRILDYVFIASRLFFEINQICNLSANILIFNIVILFFGEFNFLGKVNDKSCTLYSNTTVF